MGEKRDRGEGEREGAGREEKRVKRASEKKKTEEGLNKDREKRQEGKKEGR